MAASTRVRCPNQIMCTIGYLSWHACTRCPSYHIRTVRWV